jgi:predicted TIM-barrel fold metal-dependent hydrolase
VSKIWANSGDSHLVEPADLFTRALPPALAERMPRSVKDPDGGWETIHVDGQQFRRRIPRSSLVDPETGQSMNERAPGSNDPRLRLKDLDQEGIWAELIYPSIGIWASSIKDPKLLLEGTKAINDWAIDFQQVSPRYVCAASIPLLDVDDAVSEIERSASLGFKAVFFPVAPPGSKDWNDPSWEPIWSAFDQTGTVLGFHIGTEPHDASTSHGQYYRGAGGALLNYVETTYGGQRAAAKLVASGVFDRHPDLKVIVSEGGATWGPFLADRLDEAYRQHTSAVRPRLEKLPSEYVYTNIYASFQHDRSAVKACTAMGWRNVCWGSDYPHFEGTYGHSQKTLHELFDDLAVADRRRITVEVFEELFPHVPAAPADEAD